MSVALPAAKGMNARNGLVGQVWAGKVWVGKVWAWAYPVAARATHAMRTATMRDLTRHARKFREEDIVMSELTRITQHPAVMGGRPCIRGMRVTVGRS
jgi:hypothetical protein